MGSEDAVPALPGGPAQHPAVSGWAIAVTVLGLGGAALIWGLAGMELCGLSGCSRTRLDVGSAPRSVQGGLLLSGLAAALGPAVAAMPRRSGRLLALAGLLLVLAPVLGALLIGVRLDD